MNEVSVRTEETRKIICLNGRVDSNNSRDVEKAIEEALGGNNNEYILIDADKLEYISSAGLRVLMHLRKNCPDMKIINASSEIYEIFDMTGFTEIISIEKAYKTISIEGCEVIGQGANGTIYRVDQDNVVKVYNNPEAL